MLSVYSYQMTLMENWYAQYLAPILHCFYKILLPSKSDVDHCVWPVPKIFELCEGCRWLKWPSIECLSWDPSRKSNCKLLEGGISFHVSVPTTLQILILLSFLGADNEKEACAEGVWYDSWYFLQWKQRCKFSTFLGANYLPFAAFSSEIYCRIMKGFGRIMENF